MHYSAVHSWFFCWGWAVERCTDRLTVPKSGQLQATGDLADENPCTDPPMIHTADKDLLQGIHVSI